MLLIERTLLSFFGGLGRDRDVASLEGGKLRVAAQLCAVGDKGESAVCWTSYIGGDGGERAS